MKMTEKQRYAVDFEKGNILVSASAGSGKTCVMVSRILRLIIEGKADADNILCVTFTVLAASEMKQKIKDVLAAEIAVSSGEEKQRLIRQSELIRTANISTVHAFCKNLIKEFFYEAGVDPSFTVMSDSEREVFINRAIDRYFEDLYQSESPLLKILLPVFFNRRSDKKLKSAIIEVYNKITSEPDPFKVLSDGQFYYTQKGVDYVVSKLNEFLIVDIEAMKKRAEAYAGSVRGFAKYEAYVAEIINRLDSVKGETLYDTLDNLSYVSVTKPTKKKSVTDEAYLRADSAAAELAKSFSSFKRKKAEEYACRPIEEEYELASKNAPVYQAFCYAVKGFSEYFAEEKRAENCVDFSDFEHLALKLLKNKSIGKEVRSRFKYVFTDEYQDTSGVQEEILSLVSDKNLFMVGDVKQNIYDFRGCDPSVFIGKRELFTKKRCGKVVDLDKNFRSTKKVIDCVNNVFSSVMTPEYGGADYKSNPMIFGAAYPESEGEVKYYAVERSARENSKPKGVYGVVKHLEEENEDGYFREARFIASLILDIHGKPYQTGKDGKSEKIDYGDITILLRSANSSGDEYAKELIACGIPVSASSKRSIGEYAEIAFVMDLLRLIACFNCDIPLASVLKSPVGNVSDAELYRIRKSSGGGSFVDAYRNYINEFDDELSAKLKAFDEYFAKIRLLADFMPCDELLSLIVEEKSVDVFLTFSRLGEMKMARLNAFIRACGAKKQSVGEFLESADDFLKNLSLFYDDENAVKIMSIHASKGLEYPVVILAGANKAFNDKDKSGNIIYDRKTGIGMNYMDADKMLVCKTAYVRYLQKRLLVSSRSEEMRILYVAMTRARNSLYIVGEYKNGVDFKLKHSHYDGEVLSARTITDFFAEGDMPFEKAVDFENAKTEEREVRQVLIGEKSPLIAGIIKDNILFKYPGESSSALLTKRSVTAAAHFDEEDGVLFERTFLFGDSDTKTGSAYHRFLELCNFNATAESEINRLIGGHLLTDEEKSLLDEKKLERILKMPVFKEIAGGTVYKEQPFTAFLPAREVEKNYDGDGEILVQGIIDLLCVFEDGLIIADYKHTTISKDEDLIKSYAKQLKLYALAAEKVLGKKVKKTYLINIYSCRAIDVDLSLHV